MRCEWSQESEAAGEQQGVPYQCTGLGLQVRQSLFPAFLIVSAVNSGHVIFINLMHVQHPHTIIC